MVRKRGRNSKRYYESEEENDSSDLELDLDESSQAAPKKYSLRQRKRPLFTEDFDYDEDEDVRRKKNESDDDFQVEDELAIHYASSAPVCNQQNDYNKVPAATGELIDFEDMIRADIVVNKRKMNADKAVKEVTQPTGSSDEAVEKTKPQVTEATDVAHSYFEPQIGVEEDEPSGDEDDQDYNPVEDLEAIHGSKDEEKEYEIEKSGNDEISSNQQCEEDPLSITIDRSNEVLSEKSNPEPVSDSPSKQLNGLSTPVQISPSQIKESSEKTRSQSPLVIEDDDDDDDDDDVVFIEDPSRSEIIVLDD